MELVSKEINGVIIYYEEKSYNEIERILPAIKYVPELNKFEYKVLVPASGDGSDWEGYSTFYFDSIQDIIKFLGLDIEEEK